MGNCERIGSCSDATNKGIRCIHYNNYEGEPCDHEATYWYDVKHFFGGIIDEKHRFPLYKPGDEVYVLDFNDIDFTYRVSTGNLEIEKITIEVEAKSDRDGWYYQQGDDFYQQFNLFDSEKDAIEFGIKYLEEDAKKILEPINILKKKLKGNGNTKGE